MATGKKPGSGASGAGSGSKSGDIGFNRLEKRDPAAIPGGPPGPPPGAPPIGFPGIFMPPPGADYFTMQDEVDTNAVQQVVFGNTIEVPKNYESVINTLQFFSTVSDASLAGSFFRLTFAGKAVQGFEKLQIPQLGGNQSIGTSPAFVRGPAQGGFVIGAFFQNVLGGAHHVGVFIQGWYWPRRT